MLEVKNISGFIETDFVLKENKKDSIIIEGLLLPRDNVSRNGILYDWDTIKAKYKELIKKPVMYNHKTDTHEKPIGHVIDTWLKETSDSQGIAGWYYKANLNPKSEYIESILRGDLQKVSIQVVANATKSESSEQGERYTRAFIGSILEMSIVPCPGFENTSIELALAEAFKTQKEQCPCGCHEKEAQTTANNPTQVKLAGSSEESDEEENMELEELKKLTQENASQIQKLVEAVSKKEATLETEEESAEENEDELSESAKVAALIEGQHNDTQKIVEILQKFNSRLQKLESYDEEEKEESTEDEEEKTESTEEKEESAEKEDEVIESTDEEKPTHEEPTEENAEEKPGESPEEAPKPEEESVDEEEDETSEPKPPIVESAKLHLFDDKVNAKAEAVRKLFK